MSHDYDYYVEKARRRAEEKKSKRKHSGGPSRKQSRCTNRTKVARGGHEEQPWPVA